jgi:hypothetical protein
MKRSLIFFLLAFSSVVLAKPESQDSVKLLKKGEIYSFVGTNEDESTSNMEITCRDLAKVDQGDFTCGHTKQCTAIKPGEEKIFGRVKFTCAEQ